MSRHRIAPSARRRAVSPALVGLVLLLALALSAWVVTRAGTGAGSAASGASRAAAADTVSAVSPSPSPSESDANADADEALSTRLASALGSVASDSASLQVAVLDLDADDDASASRAATASYSGEDGEGGEDGETYDTASIVKVDILAALLLQAQDEGRVLTAQERTYASAMIRNSDNAATNVLWSTIGGATGLDAANRRLGLTGTTGGSGKLWGLTQSTASDQVALLAAVFAEDDADTPLSAASRAYMQGLMGAIADGQDWGVSAAGTATGLKNGWLSRSATGLWDINSIGLIEVDGHSYLLAVLSDGSGSMASGISLVERAAQAAVAAASA
ncbi:serine hydrolase [Streptomyces sp. NPDC093109]|uniref:serine hydrolase n=1 Tax=Streptomyces sp. NPDC093109 TaxID=3154977 RepID=UPI00344BFACD